MATSPAAIAPVTAAAPPPPGVGVLAASPARKSSRVTREGCYDKPTTWPSSSMSIRTAAGLALSPGMVRMSPQIG